MRVQFEIDMVPLKVGASVPSEKFTRNNKKLLWLMEALIKCNGIWLDANPDAPLLYDSGVRYQREKNTEAWLDIPNVIRKRHGDCEDLAAWRVAELRRRFGVPAKARLKWYTVPSKGFTLYHVQVALPDGQIEDPSRILGMKGKA